MLFVFIWEIVIFLVYTNQNNTLKFIYYCLISRVLRVIVLSIKYILRKTFYMTIKTIINFEHPRIITVLQTTTIAKCNNKVATATKLCSGLAIS